MKPYAILSTLISLSFAVGQAQAAIVVDSLPYKNTPDWTDFVLSGTSMTPSADGQSVTLQTTQNTGVWFGWGAASTYGDQPTWTPGTNTAGNHVSVNASFSADAADWSTYFYDKDYFAAFLFAPTGCNSSLTSCYGTPGAQGVTITHGGATDTEGQTTFIPLDLAAEHSYEFLLKGNQVSYRIDGLNVYSGLAFKSAFANPLLVIGDGSGSTPTGEGAMTIYGVSVDNAPLENELVSTVPLPSAAWLFASGLLGVVRFVRRSQVPA